MTFATPFLDDDLSVIAMAVPDTMELVDYREGSIELAPVTGRASLGSPAGMGRAVLVLFGVVFANLGTFSEFLYYQF